MKVYRDPVSKTLRVDGLDDDIGIPVDKLAITRRPCTSLLGNRHELTEPQLLLTVPAIRCYYTVWRDIRDWIISSLDDVQPINSLLLSGPPLADNCVHNLVHGPVSKPCLFFF